MCNDYGNGMNCREDNYQRTEYSTLQAIGKGNIGNPSLTVRVKR